MAMASAKAKASGDGEMLTMVDLLNRARMLDLERNGSSPLDTQPPPLTGPAQVVNNPFERSFAEQQTESPTDVIPLSFDGNSADTDGLPTPTQESVSVKVHPPPNRSSTAGPWSPPLTADTAIPRHRRASLKRTFTDVRPLSLQNKLTEAMTQPYHSSGSDRLMPKTTAANPSAFSNTPVSPVGGSRQAKRTTLTTQAIFTTEAKEPWTISAANDLGCLIFGLSKNEFRKMSILEIFREDKRQWLEAKLRNTSESVGPTPASPRTLRKMPSPRFAGMGGGITARLLSKPSSRENGQAQQQRRQSENVQPQIPRIDTRVVVEGPTAQLPSSRGVLLCGEVLPVTKRNGSASSASLWVQEKRNNLIWVLEEIVEDVAFVGVDEVGCVTKARGACEAVWGMERVRRGMDITRLIPGIPRLKDTNTGALDFNEIETLRRFTARTANDISIPLTVDRISEATNAINDAAEFRVSSFPHIAGMMVLNASTLKIKSCNTVVADTLFGRVPNDLPMNNVVPHFDKMLEHLTEDEKVELVEGMVIPQHSFRRARAMLALREGKEDAAAVFLRPSGLPALHRDGAEIMVDVQMRVVKSESLGYDASVPMPVMEDGQVLPPLSATSTSEVVYALWITYSRILHAVNHGVGSITPLVSRPSTPPCQPSPSDAPMSRSSSSSGSSVASYDSDSPPTPRAFPPPTKSQSHPPPPAPRPPPAPKASSVAPATSNDVRARRSITDYTILEDMGAGAYGQVKLARHKTTNNKVVIKYVTKARILVDTWTRDRKLGTVPLEIHVLDYLARTYSDSESGPGSGRNYHPNIVQMSAFFEDDTNYYIEMLPHGLPGMDLFDYIELRNELSEYSARDIFRQIAEAVRFLHVEAGVVHRDIKDENVILDRDERIRLVDFGSSSYIRNGPFDVFVGTIGEFTLPGASLLLYCRLAYLTNASIDYAAPEVLAGTSYSGLEQDVWAMGILLYTILFKENPFYSIDEIMDRDLRVPVTPVVSEGALDLVRSMLVRDVPARMRVTEVVEDDWLQGGDGGPPAMPSP